MRPASPERGFSTATTAMFRQNQTLMLHLFTATSNALWSTFGRALLTTLLVGLTCYADGTDLTCVSGGKATRNAGGNPVVSQEKHVVPVRHGYGSLCTSGPRNLTTTYNDYWIGQGGPMAWPPRSPDLIPMDFFLWGPH